MRKRWVALLLLATLALLFPCSAFALGLPRVQAAKVLRWGADVQGGEPYVSQRADGTLSGFEVEIAAALGRELGVRPEMVQNDWSTLIPALERGTFDVIMNGFEITLGRAGRVAFSRPYYVFAERLMVRHGDARFSDLASLRGHRVGTLSQSLAFEMLRPVTEPVLYEGVEEPYIDLVEGRIDAVLMDDIIATRYGSAHPELAIARDLREGYYAIAARTDEQDLLDAIDAALGRMIASGELRAIFVRAGIDSDREANLPPAAPAQAAVAPPAFGIGHVVLFLKGAGITLIVSVLAMLIAFPLGLLLAVTRAYGPKWLSMLGSAYVEVYRGTPVLLQLYVLYFGLAPIVKISAMTAAIVGLGMNYAAYEAEVHRAGIQAVPRGQMEAARALGMSVPLALRRIILPQSVRLALPNVTSDFIALMKDSSLVSVITVVELTKQMTITSVDVRGWLVPGIMCALFYFLMSYPLARLSRRLERH